jgi:hypothetical protein
LLLPTNRSLLFFKNARTIPLNLNTRSAFFKTVKDTKGYLAIRYNDFIPLLVRAVQEQDARIESQNTKIAELEALVKTLVEKIK